MLFAIVTGLFGAAAAVAVLEVMRTNRRSADVAAWILVSNVNTLLRLDLDHLTGDDENAGLRELRTALKEAAVKRPAAERKLFERFNALVGIAIAFGEKVHDAGGNIDLRAVANRRDQLQNALALGDRLEAALGGISELARAEEKPAAEHAPSAASAVLRPSTPARGNGRGVASITALPAPASGAAL
ncbi:MAG TPA: hypothetical protein VHS78_15255 [Candidatus Elarobacter sp.]|nr:hypothetical protein [Candidatus Elarobacter sp.]